MLTEKELGYRLSELALGRVAIRDFENWFAKASWNTHAWASVALQEAVYSLELAFAEYSNQHVTHSYLRAFAGEIAWELGASVNSIPPTPVGSGISSGDFSKACVPARPLQAA